MDGELRERLTKIETKFDTWRDLHNDHSIQRHKENLVKFDSVFKQLKNINGIKTEVFLHRIFLIAISGGIISLICDLVIKAIAK